MQKVVLFFVFFFSKIGKEWNDKAGKTLMVFSLERGQVMLSVGLCSLLPPLQEEIEAGTHEFTDDRTVVCSQTVHIVQVGGALCPGSC